MRKSVSFGVLLYLVFSVNLIYAGLPTSKGPVRILSKTAVQDFNWYAANRIGTYISNVGELVSARVTGNPGMEWPIESGKTINYQSGLWIGGLVGTQIRTAAARSINKILSSYDYSTRAVSVSIILSPSAGL